jgi:hypothetical protein
MGLPQSLCADDRWLRIVNELEIAIELTIGSLGGWSAIRQVASTVVAMLHLRIHSRTAMFTATRLSGRSSTTLWEGVIWAGN